MPNIQCLVTLNDTLLMTEDEPGSGNFLPIHASVPAGESPLEACGRAVLQRTGFHVSPSCAGVIYAPEDAEHDYTLIFVADAPAGSENLAGSGLRWAGLHGIRDDGAVPPLQRELIPLILTADGPLVVMLEAGADEPRIKEHAPIAHARLSPLVFAIAK